MSEKIISKDNPKLKFARGVRDGREAGYIFIEGVRLAGEALRSEIQIRQAFIAEGLAAKDRIKDLAHDIARRGIDTVELSDRAFQSIAETVSSQGIALLAERPASALESIERRLKQPGVIPLVLFLNEINNPSNLGAILRTSEAAGIAGVIVSPRSADVFSPKSLRASMGAAFRLPVEIEVELGEVLQWAASWDLTSTAADIGAAAPYTSVNWQKPRLLVFGSEAHGLPEEDLRRIAEPTFIPMQNGVESLNLAVSCGIILFEAVRQNSA
jgi:TrmH family RNA methyltransferase